MNNIIKQINIEMYSPTHYEVIKAQQGDNKTRIIEFSLYDQGNPYTIPNNVTFMLEGHRGDNSSFIKDDCFTISSNKISVTLDKDVLYASGIAEMNIVMYDTSNDNILSTIPFRINIQKNPCDKNKLEHDKKSLIDDIILSIEKIKEKLTQHISDKNNPHTVTKTQVGLSNVPNVTTNNQTPTYTKADTISELSSGEKLSVAFGKIAKSISELILHFEDNICHITSTERSNWNDLYDKAHTHSNKNILDGATASYTTEEKNKLKNIQLGAEVNVQSDWNVTDTNSDAFIKNKPSVYTKNEVDNKFSTLETNIDWKESVETYADIAKTYSNPQDGWTVNVKDTDYTYRYNGKEWVAISANAIPKATNAVDGLLSKEDHANYDDANSKKHSHSNKSVLDKITQSLLDNWNSTSNAAIIHYGKCSTDATTATKVVACTGFTLTTGATILVRFGYTNTAANPTLNVNNTGAKAIYYRGSAISAGHLAANRTYEFVYNGMQYELVGTLDTNTMYTNFVKSGSGAKSGLVPAPSTTAGTTKYLREDGTWQVPPNTQRGIQNNLTSTSTTDSLSAAQGKILNEKIDALGDCFGSTNFDGTSQEGYYGIKYTEKRANKLGISIMNFTITTNKEVPAWKEITSGVIDGDVAALTHVPSDSGNYKIRIMVYRNGSFAINSLGIAVPSGIVFRTNLTYAI